MNVRGTHIRKLKKVGFPLDHEHKPTGWSHATPVSQTAQFILYKRRRGREVKKLREKSLPKTSSVTRKQ